MNIHKWPYFHWNRSHLSTTSIGGIALGVSMMSTFTFNAFAKTLGTALSPLSLLFISELMTAFFVLFSFGLLPTVRRLFRLRRRQLMALIGIGIFSGCLGPLLLFTGLGFTSAINASLFGKVDVIFLILIAHFVLSERILKIHFVSIAAVVCGVLFISLEGFTQGLQFQWGDLIIIASSLCYVLGSMIYRTFIPEVEPHVSLFMRSSTALLAFFLVSPFIEHTLIEELAIFPLALIIPLIGFGFVSRFLNAVMFYQALEYLPVITISLVGTLDAIGSTVFSWAYLGEPILWYHISGGAFIVLGNIMLALHHTPTTKHHVRTQLKHRG